ncbi:MAG: hypothetical protein IIC00_15820 [Planctomycetes bacterium]|nr:hypothetical protein [Planctomycetota bacterium]
MTENEQSSEVKEEDLAQEALDATAADEPVTEPKVPLHEHTALRQRAQQAEVAQARAEGELAAIRQKAVPAVKSPLDLEVERQAADGIAEADMTVSPALIREQQAYDLKAAEQTAVANRKQELGVVQVASANKAKAAHADWQAVIAAGDGLLSAGEILDIAATGEGFGEMYYEECRAAAEKNVPKSDSSTDTAPETNTSESEAVVPTQQEILKDIQADPQTIAAAQL